MLAHGLLASDNFDLVPEIDARQNEVCKDNQGNKRSEEEVIPCESIKVHHTSRIIKVGNVYAERDMGKGCIKNEMAKNAPESHGRRCDVCIEMHGF